MTLDEALKDAVASVTDTLEEEGGIILTNRYNEFKFIKLKNRNSGNPVARVLFTADPHDYAEKVFPLMTLYNRDGKTKEERVAGRWWTYATFHTHPVFEPYPSAEDMNEMFPKTCAMNYIYSPLHKVMIGWLFSRETGAILDDYIKITENDLTHKEIHGVNATKN